MGPLTDSQRAELMAVHMAALKTIIPDIEVKNPDLELIRDRCTGLSSRLSDFYNAVSPSQLLIPDFQKAINAEEKAFRLLGTILDPLTVTAREMRQILSEVKATLLRALALGRRHDPEDTSASNPPPTNLPRGTEERLEKKPHTELTPI
jgi:hypothetical protein